MMSEFEVASIAKLADSIIDTSRRSMLRRIAKLRPGTYHNRMTIDGYDRDLELACALTVSPAGIRIDFDGSSPISSYGINVPLTYTRAYASFGVRCIVGADVPNNAGSLSAIQVSAPLGVAAQRAVSRRRSRPATRWVRCCPTWSWGAWARQWTNRSRRRARRASGTRC